MAHTDLAFKTVVVSVVILSTKVIHARRALRTVWTVTSVWTRASVASRSYFGPAGTTWAPMRVIGTRGAWGVSMAARLTPLASGALATRGFAFAHALQHFAACGFGCSGHDLSAGRATGTTPNGLTAHGNGLRPFFGFRAKTFDLNNRNVLFGEGFNGLHKAFFV